MTNERMKKIISASVVTAVLFLVILLGILVYQMVCLNRLKAELDQLNAAKESYLQLKESQENEIQLWLEEWKIEEAARKYGFRSKGN